MAYLFIYFNDVEHKVIKLSDPAAS